MNKVIINSILIILIMILFIYGTFAVKLYFDAKKIVKCENKENAVNINENQCSITIDVKQK